MSNLLMRKSTVQAEGPSILAAPFPPPFPVKSSGLSRWLRALPSGHLQQSHPWSGNARELENVVERAVILSFGGVLRPEAATLSWSGAKATTGIGEIAL